MVSALTTRAVSATDEPVLRRLLQSILRYRIRFLSVFLFFFLLTMLYVFLSPKKYESDMSVVVQNARRPDVLSAEPTIATQALVAQVTEDQVNSQMEILASADVLDEVVDPGWRKVPFSAHSRDAELAHEAKVNRLRKHLQIQPVKKSDVIDVGYRTNDPQEATATLSRLLAVYLDRDKLIAEPAGASRFFNDQAARYQKDWAQARQELSDFQQKHDIVSIDDKQAQLQLALQTTLELQREAEADVSTIGRRLSVENSELASTPIRQKTGETLVPASGSIDQVNAMLAQLTLRRAQLVTEYLPTDPIVRQLDSQIEQAKAELANAKNLQSTERSTAVNPTWQLQDEAIAQDKAALRAGTTRAAKISAQVDSLNQELHATEADAVAFESLQHKVAELESDYRLYLQKRDTATISEAMNENGFINIAVAQSPSFSLSPVRPRPLVDSVLGFITSLFLACFAVYAAETSRRTIGSPTELGAVSRYPLLATVAFRPIDAPAATGSRWKLKPPRVGRPNRPARAQAITPGDPWLRTK